MALVSSYEDHRSDEHTRRRGVRFFWVVLIASSAASVAGNAIHAAVNATAVPAALAAAVATAPPLVLLASTEGLSLLIKVRRRPSVAYWGALAMTTVLAAAAFRLSFDALRDLATRCGIRASLAWLWPVVVDVTMTQATVSLLALTRRAPERPAAAEHPRPVAAITEAIEPSEGSVLADHQVASSPGPRNGAQCVPETDDRHEDAAARVVATKRTKQPPEVVAAVLARHQAGQKVSEIGNHVGLHHSTVSRIVANADRAPTPA